MHNQICITRNSFIASGWEWVEFFPNWSIFFAWTKIVYWELFRDFFWMGLCSLEAEIHQFFTLQLSWYTLFWWWSDYSYSRINFNLDINFLNDSRKSARWSAVTDALRLVYMGFSILACDINIWRVCPNVLTPYFTYVTLNNIKTNIVEHILRLKTFFLYDLKECQILSKLVDATVVKLWPFYQC